MNVHHQLPTSSSSSSYDEVVGNFLHHHSSNEYFFDTTTSTTTPTSSIQQQILNNSNSNNINDSSSINGFDGNQLPPISGTFMGFSITPSNLHHHLSDTTTPAATAALEHPLSTAGLLAASMTPGINIAIETAKQFYIKDEENTILCDEIGTFYCSQKENKNFDGIDASCDTSSSNNNGGRASTSANNGSTVTAAAAPIYHACFNCHETINDKWLIFVNNTHWHVNCLKCSSCSQQLNDLPTCFWRENRIFCKSCYQTQFVEAKCAACQRPIAAKDWVRRAREFVYHLACFACSHCKRQLSTGEEFSLTDNRLLCKQHYLELIHGQCKAKTKRVRTTFAEEQLSVLQAHFQIDSNPDGADLEKIANITGLSKRVTQVWFQNSRARQKKYQGSKKSRLSGGGSDRCGSSATANNSGRSSASSMGSAPGSPGCGDDGMMFPTSVTTSADDIIDNSKPMDSMMFSE